MVGSYSEAEDLVQEAFVRFHEATRRGVEIESTTAFLTTVTTRLAEAESQEGPEDDHR